MKNGKVITLTRENFDEEVINSSDVVLVDFGLPGAGHAGL